MDGSILIISSVVCAAVIAVSESMDRRIGACRGGWLGIRYHHRIGHVHGNRGTGLIPDMVTDHRS